MLRTVPVKVALAIGVVLLVSYGYFYQGGGWNQNTRLDVIRAVTEHGTLRIDAYAANTGDRARFDGHLYSDKAPGQPLLALAPVALADRSCAHWYPDRLGTRDGFLAYVGTVATASLPAIVAALALYWLALALGVSVTGGAIGALAFGLATPMWAYATLFWSHALACACLVLAFAACVALGRERDARRRTVLAGAIGLAGGWAIITDYTVAPAVLIVVALGRDHGAAIGVDVADTVSRRARRSRSPSCSHTTPRASTIRCTSATRVKSGSNA